MSGVAVRGGWDAFGNVDLGENQPTINENNKRTTNFDDDDDDEVAEITENANQGYISEEDRHQSKRTKLPDKTRGGATKCKKTTKKKRKNVRKTMKKTKKGKNKKYKKHSLKKRTRS